MLEHLQSFLKQANIGQSRSSVLNPIQWLLVILIGGFCLSLLAHAPTWFTIILGSGTAAALLLFFAGYIYFGKTNPDALRSEHYSLTKLAIQHRLLGDSLGGVQKVAVVSPMADENPLLAESSEAEEQQQ